MPFIPLTLRKYGGPFDLILINGQNQMGFLTLTPDEKRQVSNLAPTINTGGDSRFSTDAFQEVVIQGFDQGQDKERLETGDHRYSRQSGGIAAYHPNRIMLASKWNVTDAGQVATARSGVDLNVGDKFSFMAAGTKLRAYNHTTQLWGNKGTFGASAIHLFANDQYAFISCGTTEDFWRGDGTTFTQPAAGKKFNVMASYNGVIYGALANNIYSSANNGTTWSKTAVTNGFGWAGTSISDMKELVGLLFVAKPEGLYAYDGTNVFAVYPMTVGATVGNFTGMGDWQGALYMPIAISNSMGRGQLAPKTGFTAISDVTPKMSGTPDRERYGHGVPLCAFSSPSAAYFAFNDGEGVYPELLRWNGVGNDQIYRGDSGDTLNAAWFSRLLNRIFINTTNHGTMFKSVVSAGDAEYADFPASEWIESSSIDGGFPPDPKAFQSATVRAEGCSSRQRVIVGYRLDDAALVEQATITSNGYKEIPFGGEAGQVQGKRMVLYLRLETDDDDLTPVVRMEIVIKLKVVGKAVDKTTVTIILDNQQGLRNGFGLLQDAYPIEDQTDFLEDARNAVGTITLMSEFGRVTGVGINGLGDTGHRTGAASQKRQIPTEFLDYFPGLRRQVESILEFDGMTVSTSAASDGGFRGGAFRGGSTRG